MQLADLELYLKAPMEVASNEQLYNVVAKAKFRLDIERPLKGELLALHMLLDIYCRVLKEQLRWYPKDWGLKRRWFNMIVVKASVYFTTGELKDFDGTWSLRPWDDNIDGSIKLPFVLEERAI